MCLFIYCETPVYVPETLFYMPFIKRLFWTRPGDGVRHVPPRVLLCVSGRGRDRPSIQLRREARGQLRSAHEPPRRLTDFFLARTRAVCHSRLEKCVFLKNIELLYSYQSRGAVGHAPADIRPRVTERLTGSGHVGIL